MASTTQVQVNSPSASGTGSGSDRYEKLKAAREKALGSVAVGTASAMVLAHLDNEAMTTNNISSISVEDHESKAIATEATPLVNHSTYGGEQSNVETPQSNNPCEFMGNNCLIM